MPKITHILFFHCFVQFTNYFTWDFRTRNTLYTSLSLPFGSLFIRSFTSNWILRRRINPLLLFSYSSLVPFSWLDRQQFIFLFFIQFVLIRRRRDAMLHFTNAIRNYHRLRNSRWKRIFCLQLFQFCNKNTFRVLSHYHRVVKRL